MKASDEPLEFVQLMVVLEVLLGDERQPEIASLGEVLRSRCSYLLARNHTERSEIERDFRAIYQVRSEIVHRGKVMLRPSERAMLFKLETLAKRVIRKEVDIACGMT